MRLASKPIQRRKILVIEDEADIRDFLYMLLTRYDYEVETADSGLSGLAALARFTPDIVILDLAMPDMDGMTFLARRARIDRIKTVPVIILSARDRHGDVVDGLAAGATAYIAKPFDNAKLVATVRKLAGPAVAPAPACTRVSW